MNLITKVWSVSAHLIVKYIITSPQLKLWIIICTTTMQNEKLQFILQSLMKTATCSPVEKYWIKNTSLYCPLLSNWCRRCRSNNAWPDLLQSAKKELTWNRNGPSLSNWGRESILCASKKRKTNNRSKPAFE